MLRLTLTLVAILLLGCGANSEDSVAQELPETNYYEIVTPKGRMVVRLYDETPQHRDNFKQLVSEAFYDSTLFHRVIEHFMIQGGDPSSRDDDPTNDGSGGPGYTIPAEFDSTRIHKRGALAAARQGDNVNPERASSGSQFYIVQGQPYADSTLDQIEAFIRRQIGRSDFAFSKEARAIYTTQGGTPFLDRQYTVFGEVVEGLAVLDSIAAVDTPNRLGQQAPPAVADRPLEDIWMIIRPLPEYGE